MTYAGDNRGTSEALAQISALEDRVSGVEASVSRLRSRVDALEGSVLGAIGELQQTVNTFVIEYRRDQTVQNAYNRLAEYKREWEEQFGRYREVRELAASIIPIVGSGFISRAVILDVTERLTIRTPRYWLAPAILAVAAWLDDDKDRYSDSIKSALALDHSKSALFMTLLLRHQARTEIMRAWIGSYLATLEPTNLPTDFAIVIEAVFGGTLGRGYAPQLVQRMQAWFDKAARSRGVEAEEIGQWERNLLSLAAAGNYPEQFPMLSKSSEAWELLRRRYEANTAIEAADHHFRGRFDDGAEVPADLDEKISQLLKRLAEDPDTAEDQTLRKIRHEEAVIETLDEAAAYRQVSADEAGRTRALNILSLVTLAAFPAGRKESPTMTELLAIVMSRRFICAAAEKVHDKNRRVEIVEIDLGQRRCSFSCATDDEVTRDALQRQAEDSGKKLADEIDLHITQKLEKLRQRANRRLALTAGIFCGLFAAALLSGPITSGLAIFILTLAVLTLVYGAADRILLLRTRLSNVTDDGKQEKSVIKHTLDRISEELARLFSLEQRVTELLPEFQDYLLGMTAEDVYQVIRFTAPPTQILTLSGPSDHEMPGEAAERRDDIYAHGFPEWTPWPPARAPG